MKRAVGPAPWERRHAPELHADAADDLFRRGGECRVPAPLLAAWNRVAQELFSFGDERCDHVRCCRTHGLEHRGAVMRDGGDVSQCGHANQDVVRHAELRGRSPALTVTFRCYRAPDTNR